MKDSLFNTEKKRQAAIVTFQTGINTPIWKLMTQILEANIKVVTEQILNGGEGATKEQMDRLRDKLTVYKEVINTPQSRLKDLISLEGKEPSLDPFQTPEQLKEERKKASA